MNNKIDIEKKYKRENSLIRFKLLEYIPTLIISNISTFLILTVDSIVVGNYVGADALAAIQIFYPINVLLGVFSAIISYGTAETLSEGVVKHDFENLKHIKAAIGTVVRVSALLVGIIQIPIVFAILKSYNLDPTLYTMTKDYAIGIMISMPFSFIASVGVCQLQMAGKMKTLMIFAAIEGALHLILDLIFVGKLGMGVVGAGMSSAIACTIRSILTMFYLYNKTDIHKYIGVKVRSEDVKSIVVSGLPEASSILVNAFQSYIIMRILLLVFDGSSGGIIKGVCSFCLSLVTIVISSVQGSMRPLLSVMAGSDDRLGLHNSMKIAFRNIFISVGLITIFMQIRPEFFYELHGIKEIPEHGILSLRLYVTYFIFLGFNTVFRSYFVSRNDARFETRLTLIGNLTLPIFAYVLYILLSPPHMWLCYLFTTSIIFSINLIRYIIFVKRDKANIGNREEILYLTVTPDKAEEASRDIVEYAISNKYPENLANDISMCMKEMVRYAVKSQYKLNIHIQIIIKLSDEKATFVMLDDGKCIKLDENEENQKLQRDNYEVIKKLAKSYDYQYLLNMNYSTFNFEND